MRLLSTLVLLPAMALALEPAELETTFREANDLFREANQIAAADPSQAFDLYQRSARRYERIIDEGGIENGRLYYNLGNAYFRMNDIGRAILNYRKAEQYIAGDANLRQNLRYARTRRLDRFEEQTQTRVLRTLLFWHYDVPLGWRLALFALGWVALWGLLSLRLFQPQRVSRALLVLAGGIGLMFLGSVLAETMLGPDERPGVILAPETVARKGDGESYAPAFTEPLHAGVEFQVLEVRPGWVHGELPDSRTCWLAERAVGLVR